MFQRINRRLKKRWNSRLRCVGGGESEIVVVSSSVSLECRKMKRGTLGGYDDYDDYDYQKSEATIFFKR